MKLTTLKGSFLTVKQTRHEDDQCKGGILRVKQTRHEADQCKSELC